MKEIKLILRALLLRPARAYTPGAYGTSIATLLEGEVKPGPATPIPPTKFIEASGKSFNTIPPNDFPFVEMVNELVQMEPATSPENRAFPGTFRRVKDRARSTIY